MTTPQTAKLIMTTSPLAVGSNADFNLVQVMSEWRNVRHIAITEPSGKLVGIVSARDMLEHLSQADASHFIPISKLIKRATVSATPETPLTELANLMKQNNIGCVPIEENDKLVGMVSERDFLKLW